MAETWNINVNTKFYGLDGGYKENTENVEFKSGRTITYLKNSKAFKTYGLTLWVDDTKEINGKTEFEWFLYWFENTIVQGTKSFTVTDNKVLQNSVLRFTEVPTWSGQAHKEISIALEECEV